MHLFEKILTTTPGKHAYALGTVRYNHGHSLGEKACTDLAAAEAYLESLAIAELERQIESEHAWIQDLERRKAKP